MEHIAAITLGACTQLAVYLIFPHWSTRRSAGLGLCLILLIISFAHLLRH